MSEHRTALPKNKGGRPVAALALVLSLAACGSPVMAPVASASGESPTELVCTLPTNCVNSRPGSGLEPLRFKGSAAQAMLALKAALATFPEAKIVRAEDLLMDVVFTTPAGFQDRVAFRIDEPRQLINYRSRSSFGLYDFGKNRSRMEAFVQRFGQSHTR